jgi:hypothetical protein
MLVEGETVEQPAVPKQVVDTLGARDVLIAGVLAATLHGAASTVLWNEALASPLPVRARRRLGAVFKLAHLAARASSEAPWAMRPCGGPVRRTAGRQSRLPEQLPQCERGFKLNGECARVLYLSRQILPEWRVSRRHQDAFSQRFNPSVLHLRHSGETGRRTEIRTSSD